MAMLAATLAAALLFAAVHLSIGRMAGLHGARRSGWLSFSGGIAVAYVFLHVLPDLIEHNAVLAGATGAGEWLADRIVYLVALLGLVVFYVLERNLQSSRRRHRATHGIDRPHDHVFWVHIGAFAVTNLLIGYLLLHREVPGFVSLALFAVALGVHLLASDVGLLLHHKTLYRRRARWVLAAAVLAGWLLGVAWELPEAAVSLIFAFLAGSVIMNVIKDELPAEHDSRVLPFVLGAGLYAAIVLAV
jgi:hypothetical protein